MRISQATCRYPPLQSHPHARTGAPHTRTHIHTRAQACACEYKNTGTVSVKASPEEVANLQCLDKGRFFIWVRVDVIFEIVGKARQDDHRRRTVWSLYPVYRGVGPFQYVSFLSALEIVQLRTSALRTIFLRRRIPCGPCTMPSNRASEHPTALLHTTSSTHLREVNCLVFVSPMEALPFLHSVSQTESSPLDEVLIVAGSIIKQEPGQPTGHTTPPTRPNASECISLSHHIRCHSRFKQRTTINT